MSGFKSYKIRDGVHIPSEKYKKGWDAIFGKKTNDTTVDGNAIRIKNDNFDRDTSINNRNAKKRYGSVSKSKIDDKIY